MEISHQRSKYQLGSYSFTKRSLNFTPVAMFIFGLAIHPLIAIPIGFVLKGIEKIFAKILNFSYNNTNWKSEYGSCKIICMRSATFTVTFYLVYMVLVFAIVLEILFLKDYQHLDLLRLKEFDSKLEYNQCKTNFLVNGTNYNRGANHLLIWW